jgi:hypothetical protein
MLDVHAPNKTVHTWQDFLIHIAAITIGLLMALGLEATVEWFHHRHQASQALELLRHELDQNRNVIYDTQQNINEAATTIYVDLQKATSVLNTEQAKPNRAEEDRIQREVEIADSRDDFAALKAGSEMDETESKLSGRPDLSR